MKLCPICKRELRSRTYDDVNDYDCYPSKNDHHYAERMIDGKLAIVKIRLSPQQNTLFVKVNYYDNTSEIWTTPDDTINRITLNHNIPLDFDNLHRLENKIKTYMMLS